MNELIGFNLGNGPIDQWEAELEKVSRRGLISLVKSMATFRASREHMVELTRQYRKVGRSLDAGAACDRFLADPAGETRRSMRKSQAAKKVARRRKREAKRGAK